MEEEELKLSSTALGGGGRVGSTSSLTIEIIDYRAQGKFHLYLLATRLAHYPLVDPII